MAEKKVKVLGPVVAVAGNDIDTDRIIPARFMKCVTFDGLGEYAFYDARFTEEGTMRDHPFNLVSKKDNLILLVNKNFGCGSSREHAPQALQRFGVQAIIGESFAEIFRGNCTTMGIPTVTLGHQEIQVLFGEHQRDPSLEIIIDLVEGVTSLGSLKFKHVIPDTLKKALIQGRWDSTAELLAGTDLIKKKVEILPYIHGFKR